MWKKIITLISCTLVLMSCIVLPTSAKVSTQDPSYYDYDNGFLVIKGNESTHYSTLNTALANLANNAILIFYEDVKITEPLSIRLGDYENVNIKGNKHKIIHTHNFVNHSVITDDHYAVSFINCRKNYYIDNLTIISNTGGIEITSSETSTNRAIFDNVKIYAGYSYGLINPNFYNFDVTELKAGLKTNIAERTIQTFVGMRIKQGNTYVEIHNSSIIRTIYGMALRQDSNSYTYVYNGYFRTEGTAYTFSDRNGDGCVIMVADGGKLSMFNGVVDARFVANDNGSDSARWDELATAAIRVYGSGELTIAGGIYYSTGSVIHTHYKATNSKVTINGGTFVAVDDPDYETEYNHLFRFLQGSIKISDGFFVAQRSMRQIIINHQASIDLIAGTYLAEAAKAEQLQMLIGKVDTNSSQAGTLERGIIKDENNSLVFGENDLYYNLTDAYLSYINTQYNVLATQLGYTNSSGSGSYDKGYQDGLAFGYDSGYTVGMTDGYANGYDAGYYSGSLDGFTQGLDEGQKIGYEQGKKEVDEQKYQEGYQKGFEDGLAKIEPIYTNLFDGATLTAKIYITTTSGTIDKTFENIPFDKKTGGIYFETTSNALQAAVGSDWSKVSRIDLTFNVNPKYDYDYRTHPLFVQKRITTIGNYRAAASITTKENQYIVLYQSEYNEGDQKSELYFDDKVNIPLVINVSQINFFFESRSDMIDTSIYSEITQYNEGYSAGYSAGYLDKNNTNTEQIYNKGYNDAYQVAYNDGKREGMRIAETGNWSSLFAGVMEAPIKAYQGMFSFEILGLDMRVMFGSVLTLCVVLIVVKKVIT